MYTTFLHLQFNDLGIEIVLMLRIPFVDNCWALEAASTTVSLVVGVFDIDIHLFITNYTTTNGTSFLRCKT